MERIKNILGQLLRTVPQYEGKKRAFEVYEAWPGIVGERTAKHCWPLKLLDDGTLLVAAENSAWLQSLRYLEPQILAKFEAELKSKRVKQLRFKLESKRREE